MFKSYEQNNGGWGQINKIGGENEESVTENYSGFDYPPDIEIAKIHGVRSSSFRELLMQAISIITKNKRKK